MNITGGGELVAVAVAAIITLLAPTRVTVIVFIVALCSPLLGSTTAHDGHLSSQAVLFWFRNFILSVLGVLAQCLHILNLRL